MERPEATVDLERLGFGDLSLIDGEQIDTALDLTNGRSGEDATASNVILLTDRRVIHLNTNGRTRGVVFASLQDMDTVEIASEGHGYSGFVWGGLAFVVAFFLWQVWDHPIGSALAAGVVALMGVYLIVDQWLTPGILRATFNAGPSKLQCGIGSEPASKELYGFINRLFQLKGEDGTRPPRTFSPR